MGKWAGAIIGVVLALCALTYLAADYAGTPEQVEPGTITRIDYSPAYSTGRGKDQVDHSEEWRINATFGSYYGSTTTSFYPPAWEGPGAKVMVHFHVGRLDHAVMITQLDKADW